MNNSDLCWMSAAELAAAIAWKKVSPVEVVDAVLSRIDTLKQLNAYITLDADRARAAAKAAERAVTRRSAKLGPLHGVPFSVKDLIITRDVRTTFGTPLYRDNVPTGLQIVGRRYDDVTVLRASAAFEAAHPWAQRRPDIG
jgi:aspartyl-tRNA(Asn)/glutamyl-tRNA(Gln) amidotransferase subunit A